MKATKNIRVSDWNFWVVHIFGPSKVLMPFQDEFIKRQYPRGTKRRVYIRRGIELQRFGYTDGCLGCVAAAGALEPAGHSNACRKRVEAAMLKVDVGSHELAILSRTVRKLSRLGA